MRGQQGGTQVFVDHRFNAAQLAVFAIHGGDAATTGADHDGFFLQQPLDRANFKDAFGTRAGDYTAVFVAVGRDGPTFFGGEFLGFGFGIHRADGLGRVLEGRVLGVDFDLGEQGGERHFEVQQVAQFLFNDVADHALGLGAQHVQWVRRDAGVGGCLQ
ncbi:hypothetical protein PFLmoz3_04918 [Pseudomonas fluorescens]|uniref:Uncharacterized protein n=1 Tax=Pseudomonas fluorescens TaxID=294 RepID=A0A120G699_PSEFL|nr:hypothetical protein PFLmoz3_04918 [Pseudomonas fluorescens]